VSFHVQVPGDWSVQRGHDLLEQLEAQVRQALPHATVFTHIEPIEDPLSWRDEALDRSIQVAEPDPEPGTGASEGD
jgi:divalent metal cation (Fe/Co/Zn/Cd) transporter